MTAFAKNADDVENPPVAQLRLTTAAHHLKSLSGELDLADTTGA